jgi:hypothetical protein
MLLLINPFLPSNPLLFGFHVKDGVPPPTLPLNGAVIIGVPLSMEGMTMPRTSAHANPALPSRIRLPFRLFSWVAKMLFECIKFDIFCSFLSCHKKFH